MVLCGSLGATPLAASITYELPTDSERALGKGDKKTACPKANAAGKGPVPTSHRLNPFQVSNRTVITYTMLGMKNGGQ